jgi:class 3 adenylate cyclase/pSer/pThr/pTyr-binding forkhead associated (FHA) protein
MEQLPSTRLEDLIRERARLDTELERCKELVTILFVDIVGSTRFYDEHGDVAGLVMVQKCLDLLIPLIEQHRGTVIKTIGDAILARFCDAESAVQSAVAMQRNLDERNRNRAPADQIHVRVAINLGLALLKGNDVFGDVVNVTSRIEGATGPDEIAISPSVYEKIQHLPDPRVRKKASGVELKGKLGKLDLYTVEWRPGGVAEPAPARPSSDQLVKATGLHTGLAELARRSTPRQPLGKIGGFPGGATGLDKTAVRGTAEIEEPSGTSGVRFAVAKVCPDGTLGALYKLDHPGVIAGKEGEIALTDDPHVEAQHVRFTQLGSGVYIEDLGSAHGVYLWLREPHRLKDGDMIQMGRQRLRFVVPVETPTAKMGAPERTAALSGGPIGAPPGPAVVRLNASGGEAERYEIRSPETSFGRSKGTYTFLDDPYLSATNARIRLQDTQYILEDLGSTNGTFVRIRKRALARNGDTLMIGRQLLRVLLDRSAN